MAILLNVEFKHVLKAKKYLTLKTRISNILDRLNTILKARYPI